MLFRKTAAAALAAAALVTGTQATATANSSGVVDTSARHGPRAPLIIGDSISVMGSQEIRQLRPYFGLDAIRGSLVDTLQQRLADHLDTYGTPRRLVIALGTNTAPHWSRSKYLAAVDMVPRSTQVLMIAPWVPKNDKPASESRGKLAHWRTYYYARWMHDIARERPNVCVIPWRAWAHHNPRMLYQPNGVHPKPKAQWHWAHMIDHAVNARRCQGFRRYLR